MPQYRRAYQPGGTFFITIVTHRRRPLLGDARGMQVLRDSLRAVGAERPFEVVAAVVLPDHLHVIWTLPPGDADFSSRVGRWKVLFTRAIRTEGDDGSCPPCAGSDSPSRQKHRESDIWQRRFWEHQIRDEDDLRQHLDYIHYNPVKHGHAACPHQFAASSFRKWVRREAYPADWLCTCAGQAVTPPAFSRLATRQME